MEKSGVLVRSLVAKQEVTEPILLPRSLLLTAETELELAQKLASERRRSSSGSRRSLGWANA